MSQPTQREYPIITIEDLAAIPEDRLPALLAELPEILKAVRGFMAMRAQIEATVAAAGLDPAVVFKQFSQGLRWVDDGKSDRTQQISVDDGVSVEGLSVAVKDGEVQAEHFVRPSRTN